MYSQFMMHGQKNIKLCVYICLFADCGGQSSETQWRCSRSWDTSSCRWSYEDASVWM